MREFMEYVQGAFYEATGWSRDNSYSTLNATAEALLGFPTPRGLRLTLSSLATDQFATSYQLGSVGVVDGSVSYLYSSVPLRANLVPRSEDVPLPTLLRSYRPLPALPRHDSLEPAGAAPASASLLYGRLYLPQSQLEALVIRRVTSALQLQLSAVSARHLRNGGTLLGLAQYDVGGYCLEGLASSDGGLLGLRGVYNFGGDTEGVPAAAAAAAASSSSPAAAPGGGSVGNGAEYDRDKIYGRFSAGGEVYYGALNKSGGVSLGARFATLPDHRGTPLTAMLTLNPLMGSVSAGYAVVAGRRCSLATRLDFNVFSYESAWAVGMELWRKGLAPQGRSAGDPSPGLPGPGGGGPRERSFQAKLEWRLDEPGEAPQAVGENSAREQDEFAGVLKARLDQSLRIGLLWEGRVKSLLFSLGSAIDLRKPDQPFRTLGLEIQFSS